MSRRAKDNRMWLRIALLSTMLLWPPRMTQAGADPKPLRAPDPPFGVYSLWSVPFDVQIGSRPGPFYLHDLFDPIHGPMSDFTWRGFGMQQSSLIPDPVVTPGVGYWVSTLYPGGPSFSSGAPPSTAIVHLKPGWNIIGCPTDADVTPSDICVEVGGSGSTVGGAVRSGKIGKFAYNYSDQSPNLFNDGVWVKTDLTDFSAVICPPWSGALIRVYAELDFEFLCGFIAADFDPAGAPIRYEPPLWHLDVSAGKATVRVGARSDSRKGWDVNDIPLPPTPFSEMRAYIDHSDWGVYSDAFSESFGERGLQEYAWPLAIRGSSEKTTIRWRGLDTLPPGFRAYVVMGRSAAYELLPGKTLTLGTRGGSLDAEIRITASSWNGPLLKDGRQGIIAIRNNPAHSQDIFIEYQVLTPERAELQLFDVNGRMVSQPLEIRGASGNWQVPVASAVRGRVLPSGIYFARLRLGSSVSTAKLIVLR